MLRKYISQVLTILIFGLYPLNLVHGQSKPESSQEFYTNPILPTEYMGDPFILIYENVYYLYGTNSGEGFICWSSKDLNNWKEEGLVFKKTDKTWGGSNFWAPEVYHYNDEFYLAFSCKGKDSEDSPMLLCLAKSNSPTGPFEELYAPWFDKGFSCIDAHLFFDDNNEKYLYFDRVGYEGAWPDGYIYGIIYCMKVDEQLLPMSDTVFCSQAEQDWENPLSMNTRCNEGCFVQKHQGKYYMTYSANHYLDPFYGIGYSRSDSPMGPWTKSKTNPIIGLDEKAGIYGPGHNSFFWSPDSSELFIVYHTHVSETDKRRQVNIDRVEFDKSGNLIITGPTRTPQLLPSKR